MLLYPDCTVVVATTDQGLKDQLVELLRGLGAKKILTPNSPTKVIEAIDAESVDIIISDKDSEPAGFGLRLLRDIRVGIARSFPLFVMIFNEEPSDDDLRKASNEGNDCWIAKPVDRKTLELVAEVLDL